MIKQDNRTTEERKTHIWAVVARDSFLSGWGQASNGYSRCAWAVPNEMLQDGRFERLERWVRNRGDMKYVNVVKLDTYRPSGNTKHWHIYVVDNQHPGVN